MVMVCVSASDTAPTEFDTPSPAAAASAAAFAAAFSAAFAAWVLHLYRKFTPSHTILVSQIQLFTPSYTVLVSQIQLFSPSDTVLVSQIQLISVDFLLNYSFLYVQYHVQKKSTTDQDYNLFFVTFYFS